LFAVFSGGAPARAATPIDVVRAHEHRPCSASGPTGWHDDADPHVGFCRQGRAAASVGLLNARTQRLGEWEMGRLFLTRGRADHSALTIGLATVGH
jgi:hypothetical protein